MSRLTPLQKKIAPQQAVVVSNPHQVQYLSGFEILVPDEREAFLILTASGASLIQASFSPSPVDTTLRILKGCSSSHLQTYVQKITADNALTEILIDEEDLSVSEYKALQKLALPLSPLPASWIWQQRMLKDATEITALQQASSIAAKCVAACLKQLQPGITELELRDDLLIRLLRAGADFESFPSIIAFGEHTALPHHQPTHKKLESEMAVLIDTGAQVRGYKSDTTRTIWFGSQPAAEFTQIEKIVKQAYAATLTIAKEYREKTQKTTESVHDATTAGDLDKAARSLIAAAGFGSQFNHTTGHGVGLDIHEQPSLNGSSTTVLEPGMCLTIEPGIYLAEKFGYRHENTVLLTQVGAEELTIG